MNYILEGDNYKNKCTAFEGKEVLKERSTSFRYFDLQLEPCVFTDKKLTNSEQIKNSTFIFQEPLIIDETNQYIKLLKFTIPKTFTCINTLKFEKTSKGEFAVITFNEPHHYLKGMIFHLIHKNGLEKRFYLKIMRFEEKYMYCKVHYVENILLDESLEYMCIFQKPFFNKEEIASFIRNYKTGYQVNYKKERSCYEIIDVNSESLYEYNAAEIIDGESILKHPFRVYLSEYNKFCNEISFLFYLQYSLNPRITIEQPTKLNFHTQDVLIPIELETNIFTPKELCEWINNAIEQFITDNRYIIHPIQFSYSEITGKFTISCKKSFCLEMSPQGNAFLNQLGLISLPKTQVNQIESDLSFGRENNWSRLPTNTYKVYEKEDHFIVIESSSNVLFPVPLPFILLNSPVQKRLTFKPQNGTVWRTKKSILDDDRSFLYVCVPTARPNCFIDQPSYNPTSDEDVRRNVCAVLKKSGQNSYSLYQNFNFMIKGNFGFELRSSDGTLIENNYTFQTCVCFE